LCQIICWRTLAADAAAKSFSRGFYQALAKGGGVAISVAFNAGKAAFLRAGYHEGDPDVRPFFGQSFISYNSHHKS